MAQAHPRQLPHPDHQRRLSGLSLPSPSSSAARVAAEALSRAGGLRRHLLGGGLSGARLGRRHACSRSRRRWPQGAVGVKIWKNIGMELRDPDGRYVMPDDPRLEPIIAELERDHVVLLGHQAEPLNCWLPFAKMTVRSDREYFREHPQYYMYQHPEMPSHDAILAARDRMLSAHPALRFDAVHLASLEWDVDQVAAFPRSLPQRQRRPRRAPGAPASTRRRPIRGKVRDFLIRYQDRILYGSDDAYGPGDSDAARSARCMPAGSRTGDSWSPRTSCTRESSGPLSAACVCPGRSSINSTGAMRRRCSRRAGTRLPRQTQRSHSQRPLPDSPSAPSASNPHPPRQSATFATALLMSGADRAFRVSDV